MAVIGGSVIQDAVILLTMDAPPEGNGVNSSESQLGAELFLLLGFAAVFIVIASLASLVFLIYRSGDHIQADVKLYLGHAIMVRARNPILGISVAVMPVASSLASFGTMAGGIIYAAGQLGLIRTVSPILVLTSFLITIFLNPGRLLKTAGVVIALIVASIGWDAALWVVAAVERAPIS